MAAIVDTDYSIDVSGNIRYTGSGTNNTILEFHRWLGKKQDDAQAVGNDILDATKPVPSARSTDNYITLLYPYNVDEIVMQHLYDGSIVQSRTSSNLGEDIWDGFVTYAPAGAYLYIIQNGKVVSPNFWTTALNADATLGISHRFCLKVRDNGTDIDGRRLVGICREWGYGYSEFKVNGTSRGNNTIAVTRSADLNNQNVIGDIEDMTNITNTTEGYVLLDVDNNTVDEPYYSEWNKDTQTINEFYERIKYLTRRSTAQDSYAVTGSASRPIGDATYERQAQSFINGPTAQLLTRVKISLKKTGAPTGNLVAKLYVCTPTYGSGDDVPSGSAIATSVNLDVSKLTTSYLSKEIAFETQYLMAADTAYCISLEYTTGDVSNYVQVETDSTTPTHTGNLAYYAAAAWTAVSGEDMGFEVYASPPVYGYTGVKIPGELVRGITHQVGLTTPRASSFYASEKVSWANGGPVLGTGIMFAIDSVGTGTKMWIQLLTGIAPVATDTITGTSSSATVTVTGTPTERDLSFPLCGSSTGSALIGSYGFALETAGLTKNDKITDLDNAVNTPPNLVTFTVSGLYDGEDYLLVGPGVGTSPNIVLDESQLTLNGTLSGAAVAAVVVVEDIPADTPATGWVRVKCNSGIFMKCTYNSWTLKTFTLDPTVNFSGDNATSGNDVFISYIDKLADATSLFFFAVYSVGLGDRKLVVRARDGGTAGDTIPIKAYEKDELFTDSSKTVGIIRTPDV